MPSRQRKQQEVRARFAERIAKRLAKRLREESHQTRIHGTNRLLPLGSLKRSSLRQLFGGWINKYFGKGRILTKALAREVCNLLREEFGLGVTPKDEWIRMCSLLVLARKRKLTLPDQKAPAPRMDALETQPLSSEVGAHVMQLSFKSPQIGHRPSGRKCRRLLPSKQLATGHFSNPWLARIDVLFQNDRGAVMKILETRPICFPQLA